MIVETFWHAAFEREAMLRARGVVVEPDYIADSGPPDAHAAEAPTPLAVDAGLPPAAPRLMPPFGTPGNTLLQQAEGMPFIPARERPELPEPGAAPTPQTEDWLREIAYALVDYGERFARDLLRARKLRGGDVDRWIKAAKQYQLDVYAGTDVEEHRAIIVAQLDEIHAQARLALDLKTATTALRQKALVTGVVAEDASGGLNEFSRLVKETTAARAKMVIAYDASGAKPEPGAKA